MTGLWPAVALPLKEDKHERLTPESRIEKFLKSQMHHGARVHAIRFEADVMIVLFSVKPAKPGGKRKAKTVALRDHEKFRRENHIDPEPEVLWVEYGFVV